MIHSFALVEFKFSGDMYNGQIHISEFKKLGYGYIRNLSKIVPIDAEYRVVLSDYNEKHESWNMTLLVNEDE